MIMRRSKPSIELFSTKREKRLAIQGFLSANQRQNRVFTMIFQQILTAERWLSLQYKPKLTQINQMEGPNLYNTFMNSYYGYSAYNLGYPYYQYWNTHSLENLGFAYNQISMQCYPEIENWDCTQHTQASCDSQSAIPVENVQLFEEKIGNRETRSKVTKVAPTNKKSEKPVAKAQGEQKENRNVYSNILRNFFRKINDTSKIDKLVRQIIDKRGLSLSAEDFFEHVRKLKVNHGKYLRFKKLRQVFVDQNLKEHSMIFRILFEHFKADQLLVQTLTSRKIGKWSVVLHLKGIRELKDRIFH